VLRTRIAIKELESELAYLQNKKIPLQAEFNQILNRDFKEMILLPDTLPDPDKNINRLALLDSITKNNPMLKMLDAELEANEAQLIMAQKEGMPMLGAGINYMAFTPRTGDGMSMGGKDMVMPMFKVSIPVFRKKYKAMTREVELKEQAISYRRTNTVNRLKTEWTQAIFELDEAKRKTSLYRDQTNLENQTMNLLMTAYAVSGRDFEEILRSQQQLYQYRLRLTSAIVNQHLAVARLEMLAGNNDFLF